MWLKIIIIINQYLPLNFRKNVFNCEEKIIKIW